MSVFGEELVAAGADITPVQYAALVMVECMPGMDQAALASQIAYDRATLGGVIDRLEKKGLLSRRKHPTDRRAYALYIEPAGSEMLKAAEKRNARARDRILSGIPEEEREKFLSQIEALLDPLPSF